MRRRYVQLSEREPGVRKVDGVFTQDGVIPRPDVLPAPEQYSNLELLDMLYVDGQWVKSLPGLTIERRGPVAVDGRHLLWSGHINGLTGYGKANREILFRVGQSVSIGLLEDGQVSTQDAHPDPIVRKRLDVARNTVVPDSAPLLRFYVPCEEKERRYRICFTMMETYRIHSDFVEKLNAYYDEVWTPTHWNRDIMLASGVTRPIYVMPLGVDQHLYHPFGRKPSAHNPFTFISLFQPTFRKGIEVMLPAFEEAFAGRTDTILLLATTVHDTKSKLYSFVPKLIDQYIHKSKVYIAGGKYSEQEIAKLYSDCDAYVTTSHGEGWNLPMCEAAACGLPVIAPRNSAHLEIIDDQNAFVVEPEGVEEIPGAADICGWYEGVPFSKFGEQSHKQLVNHFQTVRFEYPYALTKARQLSKRVREVFTWDASADRVLQRLSDLRS